MDTYLNLVKLESRLKELEYSKHAIDVLINKLEKGEEDIIRAVNLYLENETITDLGYNGYSVSHLMNTRNMNFFNAVGTIDWLRRSPEIAMKALSELQDRTSSKDGK